MVGLLETPTSAGHTIVAIVVLLGFIAAAKEAK
jgi:hypothetical protein